MDIIIKSFNRAFFLDHVLRSLSNGIDLQEHSVIVADDGTPERYLQEIQRRHPYVCIFRSGREIDFLNAVEVTRSSLISRAIANWKHAVSYVKDDYFLLMEDDTWFTSPVDLHRLRVIMEMRNIIYFNLTSTNSTFEKLDVLDHDRFGNQFCIGRPKFLDSTNLLFKYLQISQLQARGLRFKSWQIARRIGLHPYDQWIRNYQVYGVASAVFRKQWWLDLWEENQTEIQEGVQMRRALQSMWSNHFQAVGSTQSPVIRTSLRSSAQEVEQRGRPPFQVSRMNSVLNEAWLRRGWEVSITAGDLDKESVLRQLRVAGLSRVFGEQWIAWSDRIIQDRNQLGFF